MSRSKSTKDRGDYRRNHGRPGVLYILDNQGLREGWFKIGCSTRSGSVRARELNDEATTGTPGVFRCIFEVQTLDCGLAEERVFIELAESRNGKWGQEYFTIDSEIAKSVIRNVCQKIDEQTRRPAPLPVSPIATPPVQAPTLPTSPIQVVPANVFKPLPPVPSIQIEPVVRRFMCGTCGKVLNINQKIDCWIPRCQAKRFAMELHSKPC